MKQSFLHKPIHNLLSTHIRCSHGCRLAKTIYGVRTAAVSFHQILYTLEVAMCGCSHHGSSSSRVADPQNSRPSSLMQHLHHQAEAIASGYPCGSVAVPVWFSHVHTLCQQIPDDLQCLLLV